MFVRAKRIIDKIIFLLFIKKKFGGFGNNTRIAANRMRFFAYANNIFLGDDVSIGPECWLYASPESKIIIKQGSILGPRCKIYTLTHNYNGKDLEAVPYDKINWVSDVVIEEAVWVGESVIILPGVRIGKGAVIGAGSVVTKDIPAYSVAVGNPANVVKVRDRDRFDRLLEEKRFSRNSIEKKEYRKKQAEG